jgi:hypothetical protein
MRCSLYSSDGPLMSEGTCESKDGAFEMVASNWHMTPTVGGLPLTLLTDDGRQHYVRVDTIHVMESDARSGPTEVYQLIPLETEQPKEKSGFLKSLFSR